MATLPSETFTPVLRGAGRDWSPVFTAAMCAKILDRGKAA
jgi:hypothetical protein